VLCRTVRLDGQTSEIHLSVAHLAEQGVPYQLKEWESAVVHVEAE